MITGLPPGEDEEKGGAAPIEGAMRRDVLIVEDVTMTACLTQVMLAHQGFTSAIAYGGDAALEWLAKHQADIVLCDISMPGMTGFDVAREICARWEENRPRLIAFTAYPLEHQRTALLEAGFDDVVAKPVRAETLGAVVKKWM
ncbi:MAG TPA: response regulator [Burkholderiales bacterium]|nr:response regulator [Burkholderiales bacterium]